MTNPPPESVPSFRESIAAIDERHPLKMPFSWDKTLLYPRFDRIETKVDFFVEYIDYLTKRVDALEARLAATGDARSS